MRTWLWRLPHPYLFKPLAFFYKQMTRQFRADKQVVKPPVLNHMAPTAQQSDVLAAVVTRVPVYVMPVCRRLFLTQLAGAANRIHTLRPAPLRLWPSGIPAPTIMPITNANPLNAMLG